jgi:cardiolipin synthase
MVLAAAPPRSDLAEHAFDRASGAPLVQGNAVRVLLDAEENYPAWLEAIRSAQRSVFFENYIIAEDEVGVAFAEALAERARAGVNVRVIRDWLGSHAAASRRFWRSLQKAGVQTRVFNAPSLASPFDWITRDHRKMISVDGRLGFVTGLCVAKRWLGDPKRKVTPWRDTGVELRGPSVVWVERAFKEVWDVTGEPLPAEALTDPDAVERAGEVAVRVVAGSPTSTGLFRLDQMIAAAAKRTLWLTDAYFVGFVPYVQALRMAAKDGVDVRLLVPSTTDIPIVSRLSRAGYRPLLESGVRIFEWNGSMIHAKTAVADGRWGRVGSSNLNFASFFGNYELDVAIEDPVIAGRLEEIYLRDLSNSTEITLYRRRRVVPVTRRKVAQPRGSRRPRVGAARFAIAVGAVVTPGTRPIGAVDSSIGLMLATILVALAALGLLWPKALAYPLAGLCVWLAVVLLLKARRGRRPADPEGPNPDV